MLCEYVKIVYIMKFEDGFVFSGSFMFECIRLLYCIVVVVVMNWKEEELN